MKILWLDLNSSYAHSSLALPAIQAQSNTIKDLKWDIVSATINENVDMVVENLYNAKPDIIAATCWLFNHQELLHILSRCRSLMPNVLIILGGPEFLGDNEPFLRNNRFVDYVFRGEGEENVPHFLNCYIHDINYNFEENPLDGLCFIGANDRYIDYGKAMVKNFSQLNPPEQNDFFNWDKPFVQLETTRGCFNTCAFCVSAGEKPIRSLSLQQVKDRLKWINEHGIKNVRLLDRTFNYNTKYAKELLELFKQYPDIQFHLEIHPALLATEIKEELQKLPKGLLHLEAGIQSLREPVLETSRRKGKLKDALEGLKFLCSLDNMETHADLIAGLPLYHLHEIFEDVYTLAQFNAGEIQLESLKLLPGTEMRRRSKELGIKYSPCPPYEVLQTNEITIGELQEALRLSRLLDFYYNTKPWHNITRFLILHKENFLRDFLTELTTLDVINSPLSLERRGLLLYQFCSKHYPDALNRVTVAWVEAGMSLKKMPAERIKTKRVTPPTSWKVLSGTYNEKMRLAFLPLENDEKGLWFGFDAESQKNKPIFKATTSEENLED